jgi:hypothetical protein
VIGGVAVAALALALSSAPAAQSPKAAGAKVSIIVVPPADPGGPDKMDTISGDVTGECKGCKIVVFAKGDGWYVQPYANQTDTPIVNGRWSTDTHLGMEYAAVLARAAYRPPSKTSVLPAVGGLIVDLARRPGRR